MPNIGSQSISSITFLDSLTGFAVTQSAPINDSGYILKTTNGGDNWAIKYAAVDDYSKIMFVNQSTGFVSGGDLLKSTNGGENWFSVNRPNQTNIEDMYALSNDTIWLVDDVGLGGGVFRTTNGGGSWQSQLNLGSSNPDHIYMFNGRIGFICETNNYIRKTYDGGQNWSIILNGQSFRDIYFIDSLTGWRAYGNNMYKTTNGGLNWVTQILPYGGNIITTGIYKFSNVNADTIWGSGGWVQYPNFEDRGMIYRTTNGGDNWLYQVPDTSIHIFQYYHNKFVNKNYGWAYSTFTGVHTTNGGDPIWYTGVQQISSEVPNDFMLKQNYPNPFNPRTIIPYSLKISGYIKLIAYDIMGREIQRLVDSSQKAGEYETDFMGKFTATGVYFYRMQVLNDNQKQLYSETKKMILLK
jgi:photosystem II stability/assembly factor-like uncharacterized protein